jgi:hypothetical protein
MFARWPPALTASFSVVPLPLDLTTEFRATTHHGFEEWFTFVFRHSRRRFHAPPRIGARPLLLQDTC